MAPENPQEGVNEYRPWQADALCFRIIQSSPELQDIWYEEDGTPGSELATKTCFQCPVRMECLKTACDRRETEGIWGGYPASARQKRGRSHNFIKLVDLEKGIPDGEG